MQNSPTASYGVLEVNSALRWQVYQRLRELGIKCEYASHQPLTVEYENSTNAIQTWSVVKQLTGSRAELISFLNKCWS